MLLLGEILAAHVLRFERPDRAGREPASGNRLLAAFVLVGPVLQPGLGALVRRDGAAIGLYRWSRWTTRERLYFGTVAPLAAAAFGFVFRGRFADLAADHGIAGLLLVTLPTGLLWGTAQEFIYRGFLQTGLTAQLGGVFGVLLTNLVFTFGPLHFRYFEFGTNDGPRWGMFAAIFGIGLVFGALYRRSGNLWIPAVLHGLWPLNMS